MAKRDWQIDIRDRQSVRTTFKLSKTAWESLDKLKKWHGVTFKDVFDGLCANVLERDKGRGEKKDPIFYVIADVTKRLKEEDKKKWEQDLSRKTQVISKGCLRTLDETAKRWQIPRDALVDSSLKFYIVHCQHALEEERKKHEEALELIIDLRGKAEDLEAKLRKMLDDDDPIPHRYGYAIEMLINLERDIAAELTDGTPIPEVPF